MRIVATGSYVPEKILSNKELESLVDTSDEWITSRTGISQRRIAADDQATSDLGSEAAKKALKNTNIKAEDLDFIIVATVTPDMFFPSTACFVQQKIGASKAVCFDISAACSGFLYGLEIARKLCGNKDAPCNILLIGAEKLSSIVNWEDRNTCVLFGDGAGAVILSNQEPSEGAGSITGEVHPSVLGSNGELTDILMVPGGGSACPVTPENAAQKLNSIRMEGKEVFKQAVKAMRLSCLEVLSQAGLETSDVSLVIAHQANRRIIDAITERLEIPEEKTFYNLQDYGNTSAASIAIALDEAIEGKRIQKGEHVLLVAFGAGLTWAGSLVSWS